MTQVWNKIVFDPAFSPGRRLSLAYGVPEGINHQGRYLISLGDLHFFLNGNYADILKLFKASDGPSDLRHQQCG
jgi:hypothetical protein